jgi:hypothetical protein
MIRGRVMNLFWTGLLFIEPENFAFTSVPVLDKTVLKLVDL